MNKYKCTPRKGNLKKKIPTPRKGNLKKSSKEVEKSIFYFTFGDLPAHGFGKPLAHGIPYFI